MAVMKKPRGRPLKLTIEQRIAIRRRIIEERKKGRMRDGTGSRVVAVMEELAAAHGVTFGCIQRTVYG